EPAPALDLGEAAHPRCRRARGLAVLRRRRDGAGDRLEVPAGRRAQGARAHARGPAYRKGAAVPLNETTTAPLASQRDLFDLPRDVAYLNAAAWSPLPRATQEAGRAAMARKGQPWLLPASFAGEQHERARRAAARLIGADPADVALISSVGY